MRRGWRVDWDAVELMLGVLLLVAVVLVCALTVLIADVVLGGV